ncbi:MAG TPA: protein phosphatase 2C domain-containing protein [Pyrinomonadaceae bacterium]|nr:protein phosphatase 2C domain-containing protein [Pyrinomonadaceae bacterium]
MVLRARVYALHKAGNAATEYEDAYDFGWSPATSAPVFRCAVADGATEASFSALWATKLVRAYCNGTLSSSASLATALQGLQEEWLAQVGSSPSVQWYVEEKLRHGAFSSLVGLTLERGAGLGGGAWQAVAVGDSCLFQLRGDELLVRFPLARADEFNNRPFLLSSNPAGNGALIENTNTFGGDWRAGDIFYLMTDALAQWFLQEYERGERPWHTLARMEDDGREEAFADFVSARRAAQTLRNDDVTMLTVVTD